ncbi:MAG: PKD domain-containing protein [Ginsengibacter sp.]
MYKLQLFVFFVFCSFTVRSQSVDFTYSDGTFCAPAVVQFTPTATGSPRSYIWNFGNGTITNGTSPQVSYTKPGTYTVKLVVVYKNNAVSVSKTITINPSVTASIKAGRSYICTPGPISFTASPAGVNYQWNFGDGTGNIPSGTNTTSHTFSAKQDYNVMVTASNAFGCSDTASTVVTLKDITDTGAISQRFGCIPATTTFTASANIPANSTISSFTWNFGDGSAPVTGTSSSRTKVYNNTGSFAPSVMVTTSEGCTATYNYPHVAYGTPPTNSVAYPTKSVICGSETAKFIAKATKANIYLWNFGDGTTATVSNDTVARHKYKTLGNKTVTVTPTFNYCAGPSVTFTIDVVGVIANYNLANTCANKETFNFTNQSQGNLSTINWTFGDSSGIASTLNTSHTYPQQGNFNSSLLVIDSITGCRDSITHPIYTAKPSLVDADSSICRNDSTIFVVLNSYDNANSTYTWNVNGGIFGPYKDSVYTDTAKIHGNFSNFVVINNGASYCKDTIPLDHKMLVRGPDLNFTAPSSLCADSVYTITNNSKPYLPQDSIKYWYWNYGTSTLNDTLYQPEPYQFPRAGKFNVKLSAIDINGCFDSLVHPVIIHPLPFVQTIPTLDTLCQGSADTLIAFHNYSLTWSPATGLSSAKADTVLANPADTTLYYATATTQFGCTYRDSVLVNVFPPFTVTPADPNPYICQFDTITLKVSPPTKQITWTPADGLSNPNGYNPVVRPLQTTTYTATLADSVGCFNGTADITVHVKSLPQVDAGPDSTLPYDTPFSLHPTYSSNTASYVWTPTDSLSCNTCAYPSGVSWASTTYVVTATSDSGCIATDSVSIFVQCKDSYILMPTAFTPNDDGLNDYYYPLTRGIKKIVNFSIFNRFGQLVFRQQDFVPNDKSFGWDGKLQSELQPSAVYVWVIEAICDVGDTIYKKGSFVLIR